MDPTDAGTVSLGALGDSLALALPLIVFLEGIPCYLRLWDEVLPFPGGLVDALPRASHDRPDLRRQARGIQEWGLVGQ
jgi:hypothetical protein